MDTLIAVPTRGSIRPETVTRLDEIRDHHPGLDRVLYQEGRFSIAVTRNSIVQKFLAGKWNTLIMVDDDIIPPLNLLEKTVHLSDYDIVGIPAPIIFSPFVEFNVFSCSYNNQYKLSPVKEGIHECDAVGGACMMINRDVFTKLGNSPFVMDDNPQTLVSEEFVFCQNAKKAGFRVAYYWGQKEYAEHKTLVALGPVREAMVMLSVGAIPAVVES